ncbi:heterokaryon incompatibility protein-domain-containing protein [Rhexocercosporidium sp. MPI-PUGE-AT-0058]|nr:heterokaryon incompatibility protein-domain-containing protein [Rhexocercosporidium sp. MPI-PUGE-AT-0058]
MESFRGSHKYRRLRGSDIRVVQFKPCPLDQGNEARIEGRISHAPLDKCDFFALSYVWGDASNTRLITLDGQDFPVTVNLWSAIKSFRNRYDVHREPFDAKLPQLLGTQANGVNHGWDDHAICWWIDAICINQNATNERSKQVPRMREIYSTATRVVIWWGDVVDLNSQARITQAFRGAKKLHDVVLESGEGIQSFHAPDSKKIELFKQTVAKPEEILRTMENSILAAGYPWLRRLWTLQEAVLSREDPAVLLGTDVSHLWVLMQLQECLSRATTEGMFIEHVSEHEILAVHNNVLYNMCSLALKLTGRSRLVKTKSYFRNHLFGVMSAQLFSWGTKRIGLITESSAFVLSDTLIQFGTELLGLLAAFAGREATTPHDRLYGLLGLTHLPDLPANLRPDYRRPVDEVCFAYTTFLMKATNNLQVLCMGTGKFKGFPTWVSDFTRSLLNEHNLASCVPIFSEDGRSINVPGVNLGHVVAVYSPVKMGVLVFEKQAYEILETFLELAREIMIPASQILNCDPCLVFKEWAEGSSVCRVFGAKVADVRHVLAFSLGNEVPLTWDQQALSCVPALQTYLDITTQILSSTGAIFQILSSHQELRRRNFPLVGDYVYALKGLSRLALLRPCKQESGFEVTETCYSMTGKHQQLNEGYFEERELEAVHLY